MKVHASFGVFGGLWVLNICRYIGVHVCVCLHTMKKRKGKGEGLSAKPVIVHSSQQIALWLFLGWLQLSVSKTNLLRTAQSVPNDSWFSSRDTAIACTILTLDYCVLSGPKVWIKYWVSSNKLGSVLKNKDEEWLYGRGLFSQTKAFGAIQDALGYPTFT